jgi:hypothetical protein
MSSFTLDDITNMRLHYWSLNIWDIAFYLAQKVEFLCPESPFKVFDEF